MPRVLLKPGKEKPVLARHPWIFSGAIARADDARDGDTVDVFDAAGRWLARAYYNARSRITVRVWTWDDEPIDRAFLRARLERAVAARGALIDRDATNAYRLVNAESDGLPGLIVDRYADFVVMQFLTLGVERRKKELTELVGELLTPRGAYERSDVDVREKEGLAPAVGVLCGAEPPDAIEIRENNLQFLVDIRHGHKTGFYLDQRENRRRVMQDLTGSLREKPVRSIEILNVFAYTGAFAVYACAANTDAHVINLDASRDALVLARENMRLNGCEARGEFIEGDAFQMLRRYRDEGRSFDAIILDPPKFVHALSQLRSGLRGYKDINLLAFKLLKPGGTLATFSCSGQVSAELFQKVVFEAATDAKRNAQIIAKLLQAPDHPILLSFPESEYLKGLVCRVL
ncbi:MAG: class I SAM-dependent methyltransferase [Chloroflexota bacterium]|nr:class I SAM-dependent methyltransferase [Chloroflexota bacterium]